MDKQWATDEFMRYVSAYDPTNPRIRLKIEHTLRVAPLAEEVARSAGLPAHDVDLAWMLGLLHDIGRFEQVRRYDTFNDAASVSHAVLSVEVLFEAPDGTEPLIRSFVGSSEDDALMRTAIGTHSDFRLPSDLDERTRTLCNVLRDADKIDILRVNCDFPVSDIYGVSEREMMESELSPVCVDIFYQHSCLPRGVRQYPADIMLGHICFAWELVFERSREIVCEQGYLWRMLERDWQLPQTKASFAAMAAHLRQELGA